MGAPKKDEPSDALKDLSVNVGQAAQNRDRRGNIHRWLRIPLHWDFCGHPHHTLSQRYPPVSLRTNNSCHCRCTLYRFVQCEAPSPTRLTTQRLGGPSERPYSALWPKIEWTRRKHLGFSSIPGRAARRSIRVSLAAEPRRLEEKGASEIRPL